MKEAVLPMTAFAFLKHKAFATTVLILGFLFCLSPYASSPAALVCGVLIAVMCGNPYTKKTKLVAQKLLAASIIGLGAGMNLITIGMAGLSGFGLTFITISLTLALCVAIGRLVKSDRETSLLIAVGTAICGGSAIVAVAPVIKAKPHSIAVALGTVFILNAIALFTFPWIGHCLDLTQQQFGLWSALAIHDTSSVVGASMQYGSDAMQEGVTIKLTRALWIVPLTFAFSYFYRDAAQDTSTPVKKPWFILGFLVMAALVTWVPSLQNIGHQVEKVARTGLIVTLYLIGANLTPATLKEVGARPLLQGFMAWLIVLAATLAAVKFVL